jgi:hypothetical protein
MGLMQKLLSTLHEGPISHAEMQAAREAECPQLLELARTFNALMADRHTGGQRRCADNVQINEQLILEAGYQKVASNIAIVAKQTKHSLFKFFSGCRKLGFSIDETTVFFMKSSPMFAVAQGVAEVGWEWRLGFIGQGDTALTSSTDEFKDLMRGLYREHPATLATNDTIDLWDKVIYGCADGAANIRGHHINSAGAEGTRGEGDSLGARMWNDDTCGNPLLLHCLNHMSHLAWVKLMKWRLLFLIKMTQGVHGWFKMSPKRKKNSTN